jgi:cytochrome c553
VRGRFPASEPLKLRLAEGPPHPARKNAPTSSRARGEVYAACLGAGALVAVALVSGSPAWAQTIEEKAQACSGCHGANGIPPDKSWPVISGQDLGYLYLQLRDFKSGARKNELMGPIAAALDRDEMMALATYFSKQPWPDLRQPRAAAAVAAQAATANTSVGCTGCHQSGYQGEGTQPRLAGQAREYLASSMLAFRNKTRGNNPGMTDLMLATSEADIAALAEYLAGL